jgi:putative membrane protein insertion efficiency factor
MNVRALLWAASSPVRWAAVGLIRAYRMTFAGMFGGQCRFSPSCSHYAEDAIRTHGVLRGVALGAWRILRCNPFGAGGIDLVPAHVAMHDAVIQSPIRDIEAGRA